MLSVTLLICLVVLGVVLQAEAFLLRSTAKTSTRSLVMNAEGEAPKEWMGAKKFSMKDRESKTVFSNEQIANILPHRYPVSRPSKLLHSTPPTC